MTSSDGGSTTFFVECVRRLRVQFPPSKRPVWGSLRQGARQEKGSDGKPAPKLDTVWTLQRRCKDLSKDPDRKDTITGTGPCGRASSKQAWKVRREDLPQGGPPPSASSLGRRGATIFMGPGLRMPCSLCPRSFCSMAAPASKLSLALPKNRPPADPGTDCVPTTHPPKHHEHCTKGQVLNVCSRLAILLLLSAWCLAIM